MYTNAELYATTNYANVVFTKQMLSIYKPLFDQNIDSASVLDVGCADGGITRRILGSMVSNYHNITGVDKSKHMVKYANIHNKTDKVNFLELDITTDHLDKTLVNSYDKAFSFFCIMWIQNQNNIPVVSCLTPLCSMHGLAVTTVEGIGNTKTRLHPVQERIAKAHGSQCGFCTPGIVMSMYTLLRNMPKPTTKELMTAMQGNLCRCTGYRPIIEGFKTFTLEYELAQRSTQQNGGCSMGKNCCKLKINGINGTGDDYNLADMNEVLFHPHEFAPFDPSQEPIFPPELKISDVLDKQMLQFTGKDCVWYRPLTLDSALELKATHPHAKMVNGNTEIGVEVKFKHVNYPVYIATNLVKEMNEITLNEKGLLVGAGVTLNQLEHALTEAVAKEARYKTKIYSEIIQMLDLFASKQIRSVATLSGNVMTGSPISDLIPILMACEATLEIRGKNTSRQLKLNRQFFTGYRQNVVEKDELLISILIPYTDKDQHFYAYKQSRRIDDDIAIVNGAFNVYLNKDCRIERILFGFGGMAPTTVDAPNTSKALKGLAWNQDMLDKACELLLEELKLSPSAPGGMIAFRRTLTASLFFKAYLAITNDINATVNPKDASGIGTVTINQAKSAQYYAIKKDEHANDTVGRPVLHMSALKQACGEAIYVDDIPHYQNELYMAFVTSTKAHAHILSVDASDAMKMDGVRAFFHAGNVEENRNLVGPVFHDEELFASKTVLAEGQTIGVIVAVDKPTALRASKLVKIEYEELKPVITIEEAIEAKSYFPNSPYVVESGDVDAVFKDAKHVVEGECRMGGQEHFYLETQAVLVNPKLEDDELEIFSSTQHPSEINHLVGYFLGIPENRIVTKVKRLGGGFGGKESKGCTVAIPAALAAYKLKQPIRCMLDRDQDMVMTAGRHPFLMRYKVAVDERGKLLACKMDLYCNAGYSNDLSNAVMHRALLHMQNAYNIPNIRATGYVCKTNLPSNTAFRGFGGPQGMFAAECMVHDVAEYLKKDVFEVSKLNLYQEGDFTHYNLKLDNCTVERCWDECVENSQYHKRKAEVEEFNRQNRWKKRGITMVPTMFGIAFSIKFLNQAGSLVMIYTDGSVLLSHAGVEMGQGLNTKMIQIASKVLEIPSSKIYIVETSTDKVPNTSPTAASVGSDLNGPAVLNACQTLKDRLAPYKKKNPNGKWEDWVKTAYLDCVSLSATGFYSMEGIGYDFSTGKGCPFNYFVSGAACAEVEVDCLTGTHSVLRTDIVMDIGESLNPAIDIGQIEGGFVQGYGLLVLEEMVYSSRGTVFTKGPGAYKIPGFGDIPQEFNVSLLKGAPNPRAVYSSKAVGEPPLFLASSVFFAIKEAIKSARQSEGVGENFVLHAPATCERIRMACPDFITKKITLAEPGTFTPWNVVP